jgi:hypothetical protein
VPPVGRQRKPHTSPAQISVLPSPGSTVFTRHCHPLAFTSVSPIFDQRRSRDPPADVPARLQENSGTTPAPAPSACAPVHASWRRCFPCGRSRQPCHSTPRPDRHRPPPHRRAHRPGGQGKAMPVVCPRQKSALPRPRSPSCPAQRAPSSPAIAVLWPSLPSAPSSINGDPETRPPTFQQDFRKTQAPHPRDPPADVPARLQENSSTTPPKQTPP